MTNPTEQELAEYLIPLTKGAVAIVDVEDFDYLNQFKWCFNAGYAMRRIPNPVPKTKPRQIWVLMHRVVNKTPVGLMTDHINGNILDNRKKNLRSSTHQQNHFNRSPHKNTKSIFKGVCTTHNSGKWRAYIKVGEKQKHLGLFEYEIDAAKSYDSAALEYYGEFAHLNFPIANATAAWRALDGK